MLTQTFPTTPSDTGILSFRFRPGLPSQAIVAVGIRVGIRLVGRRVARRQTGRMM
jgi:hypothetical protein